MSDQGTQQNNDRWIEIIMVVVLCLSVTGYFIGIRETDRPTNHVTNEPASSTASVGPKPNANWKNHINNLVGTAPSQKSISKQETLQQRAKRRAYAGAPPVVPHSIDQMNASSCLACHGQGFNTSEVTAPIMSHNYLTNCTQCHVESSNAHLKHLPRPDSWFEGLKEPTKGTRASPLAPPTIPHSTWMRENCMSCHGDVSHSGIKTSHPYRTNCTQCHAPSAQLDQREN